MKLQWIELPDGRSMARGQRAGTPGTLFIHYDPTHEPEPWVLTFESDACAPKEAL